VFPFPGKVLETRLFHQGRVVSECYVWVDPKAWAITPKLFRHMGAFAFA
jgi:hypothetical protein